MKAEKDKILRASWIQNFTLQQSHNKRWDKLRNQTKIG